MQEAAILTAIQKAIKTRLDECRTKADANLEEAYLADGIDRIRVHIGGAEVGTFSLRFSKDGYTVTDKAAFDDFLLLNGMGHEKKSIKPEYMQMAVDLVEKDHPEAIQVDVSIDKDCEKLIRNIDDVCVVGDTTEVIPGIKPKPSEVIGTTLKGCEPSAVIPQLQGVHVNELLLGGPDGD